MPSRSRRPNYDTAHLRRSTTRQSSPLCENKRQRLAEGVGNAPTSAMPILFSGQVQPAYICLPSVKWSGWQELHLRPPRSEQGCLLLTIHPEIGCQGWTRTNTVRFNKPSCYFDTTWQLNAECRMRSAKWGTGILHSKLALPAGLAPASVRLEDERLVYFGHGSGLVISDL